MGTGTTMSESSSAQFGQSTLGIYYHPIFCNTRCDAGVALADNNHLLVDIVAERKQLFADAINLWKVTLIVNNQPELITRDVLVGCQDIMNLILLLASLFELL